MSQLNSVQSSPGKSHSIDPNSTLEAILEKLSKDQKDTFIPIQHIATGGTRHVYVIQKEQEDGTNQAEDGTNQKFILKYDRFGKDIANNKADELLSKGNDTQHEGCVYFNMDPSPFVTFIKRNGTIQVAKKEIHYHVEEFVEGKTLEDFLTSIPKPLKQHEIALFFEDILRGVAHIHDAGFFHRDISPDNVMIEKKKR
ncbi:MAG: protein kinase domain-containing protein [Candidatus Woesearchaeota archaeon]